MSDDLPALAGGPAVRPEGPPDWPLQDLEVARALQDIFVRGTWGKYHGGGCEQLETALQNYHDVPHAQLCGSGTFAVEWALRALRIGTGDEVLLAAYDFPGNFHAVHAVGATPVLVDLNPGNWNLSLGCLEQAVGAETKAVIVSHLHGGVVPMRALMQWAGAANVAVIEDAAQCPGALVDGRKAGTWGDVGVLSFGGSKLLSAGRGGALLTSRADIDQRARTAMFHGNLLCPLSELQAAVILPQLEKLDARNQARGQAVARLDSLLDEAGVPGLRRFRNPQGEHEPAYYKVGFQFEADAFGLSRELLVKALRAEGMAFDTGFAALHVGRSPRRFRRGSDLAEADRAHAGVVILHHPVLLHGESAVRELVTAILKIHQHAERIREGMSR